MSVALSNNNIDKYWSFLTKLDNSSKKKLIIKLTESIEVEPENKFDLRSLYGAWKDNRDADEIMKDIRASRIDNDNLIDF